MTSSGRSQSISPISAAFTTNYKTTKPAAALLTVLLTTFICFAQDQPQTSDQAAPQPNQSQAATERTVTIPAGTRLALVLTQPVQSRYVHRGDDIYAQTTSPVSSGHETVIPAGTFVQGTVEKLERRGGRGEIHLQSMSITFPDGYVTPIPGPMTLYTDEGYAWKDPGQGRVIAAIAAPAAGAGIGGLIGHSVAPSSSTITSSIPPGCTGGPPSCISSSMTVPGNAGRNTVIGAGVGGAIGAVASLALLLGSHHFYLDAGSPVEMTLQQPVTLKENEAAKAMQQSEEHPVAE